jgi:hypothetical protein
MSDDPLKFFLNEKTAGELAPDTALENIEGNEQKPFTRDADPGSLDPGERAMAGMLAVGGSAAGGLATWVGQTLLRNSLMKGISPASKHMPVQPFEKMREGMKSGPTKSRILGLFDVESRVPKAPEAAIKDFDRMDRVGGAAKHPVTKGIAKQRNAMDDMVRTVDSFIDKHNLKAKGVTTHIKQGPLNWMLGPRYELASKRVYLPDVHKDIALHELGHAADYTKGRVGKTRAVMEPLLRRGAQLAIPTALIAGDRIKEMLPGTIDDKAIEFMQNHAPEIMGATLAATTLYPEAKASVLAVQHVAKTEGRQAAIKSLKRLGAGWGTYLLGAIPAVVGLSLARKYMREARAEKGETEDIVQAKLRELEKTGGLITDIPKLVGSAARGIRSSGRDIAHVGAQIGQQSKKMVQDREVLRRIGAAAKEVGTDPTFIQGAVVSAVPAAMASLYLFGTDSGKEIRKRMDPADVARSYAQKDKGMALVTKRTDDKWREDNPLRFAGLVAAGAALSGGIMSKLFSDLARVL